MQRPIAYTMIYKKNLTYIKLRKFGPYPGETREENQEMTKSLVLEDKYFNNI
jgi:hypothetical protein